MSGDPFTALLLDRLKQLQRDINRLSDSLGRVDANFDQVATGLSQLGARVTILEAWKATRDAAGSTRTESRRWLIGLVVAVTVEAVSIIVLALSR